MELAVAQIIATELMKIWLNILVVLLPLYLTRKLIFD